MTIYKNTKIDNYFRPFAQSSKNKRPSAEDPEQPPAKRTSPLGSLRQNPSVDENESTETLSVIQDLPLHSVSKQQSTPATSKPAEPEPTVAITNDRTASTSLFDPPPIHTSSDPESPNLARPGSQSFSTSSQRVVKNGEVRIRDSDDESNSDTSLEDLDELLATYKASRRSHPPLEPEPELPHPRQAENANGSGSTRRTRGHPATIKPDSPLSSALPVIPKTYKISLESLAKQKKQYDASNEGLAQAKSILDLYDQQKATAGEKGRSVEKKRGLEADLISVAMKGHVDEDGIGRLKTAIHRTEALQHGKSWSFFEDCPEDLLSEQDDFPTLGSDHRLQPILRETSSRQQAFLSGHVRGYAEREGLPEEVMLWLMDAVCLETRDDLRYSYTATLNAADELYALLTPERVDTLFRKLGATTTAVDIRKQVVPRAVIPQSTDVITRPSLLSVLELFQRAASGLGHESRIYVLSTLCRLSLDHTIAYNFRAIRAIEKAFARLIESIPQNCLEDELLQVLTTVYETIADSNLRLQLLQSIPALPPRLILLRQRLALAFFFQDIRLLSKQPEDTINLRIIAEHLQDSQFTISNTTNYAEVAATIGILSIGIDCGDPPSAPPTKQEELAFNRDVDDLALKIKTMFTQINDTGASHMKRTEAKETLEAFHSTLLFAIRTRPLPKKNLFGDSQVRSIKEMLQSVDGGKQDDVTVLTNGV